jgi:hypothetical protein
LLIKELAAALRFRVVAVSGEANNRAFSEGVNASFARISQVDVLKRFLVSKIPCSAI